MANTTYPVTPSTGKTMRALDLFQELRVIAASLQIQANALFDDDADPALEHPLLVLSKRFKELAEVEVSYE